MSDLSPTQQAEYVAIVENAPAIFRDLQTTWAKFKLGLEYRLFTSAQHDEVISFYRQVPQLWETIKPNFTALVLAPETLSFGRRVSAWTAGLLQEISSPALRAPGSLGGLGIAPLLVAGAVLVAGLFGVSGVVWAIGYYSRQAAISDLVAGVVAGRLPVDVLDAAIMQEQGGGLFSGLSNVLTIGLVGLLAFWLLPMLGAGKRG